MNKGDLIVVSGPSGAGKTTILKELFQKKLIRDSFMRAISVTTRVKRPNEKNNRDYFFMTDENFLKLRTQGYFLETQDVLDHHYGTPKHFYARALKAKKNLLLCIDVKGGMYLKKHFKRGKIISIFIKAPSETDLFKRLKGRADHTAVIEKKIRLAKKELQYAKLYDYVVVNQDLHTSAHILESILLAEKYRR
jgi:guanylate kinase